MSTADPNAVQPPSHSAAAADAEEAVRVSDLGEEELLAAFVPFLPSAPNELVGTGDDCAVLTATDRRYCVSTDVLVQGHHFSTDWSDAAEIGARAAAQSLADVAAMGATPVALVASLVLPPDTPLVWVRDMARGLGATSTRAGAGVVGGDVSAGESLVLAVTAHGDLQWREPVLRSGAQPGDLLVLAGTLGRSVAGMAMLSAGIDNRAPDGSPVLPRVWEGFDEDGRTAAAESLAVFRTPVPPLEAGPALADAGATAMLDVSDGLLRDAGRMAAASGVRIDVDDPLAPSSGTADDLALLEPVARLLAESPDAARDLARTWVLTGGEDHGMLAAVPSAAVLPPGCRVVGRVLPPEEGAPRLTVGGRQPDVATGWDHFRG